jgi:homoserine O-acetyltransferase
VTRHPSRARLVGALAALAFTARFAGSAAASPYPAPAEGDFLAKDVRFASGEMLAEVRLHYATLGEIARDAKGRVSNAVLVLHGTTGSGRNFLNDTFAGGLFGEGQLLDARKYFIILPDSIGHGASSKPSDGLRARFPKYTYDDMIALQHRLLMEKLGVDHLRLVMGTSMGGMHTWVWGETYPDFMDALFPLASNPVQIAGRNRMLRKMILDGIRNDPEWKNGEYTVQPSSLMRAMQIMLLMVSSPLFWQAQAPTRDKADEVLEAWVKARASRTDTNDLLYAFDASRTYDPESKLGLITAPLVAVNSADDLLNPPELGLLERGVAKVKHGRAVVVPLSEKTRGHGTHSLPAFWKGYLAELLETSRPVR